MGHNITMYLTRRDNHKNLFMVDIFLGYSLTEKRDGWILVIKVEMNQDW